MLNIISNKLAYYKEKAREWFTDAHQDLNKYIASGATNPNFLAEYYRHISGACEYVSFYQRQISIEQKEIASAIKRAAK